MFDHLLHDQRIARNDANDPWRGGPCLFPKNLPEIKADELHDPVRFGRRVDDCFHFTSTLSVRNCFAECSHIRMTDLRVDASNDLVKGSCGN
jgi:hypothetical protein